MTSNPRSDHRFGRVGLWVSRRTPTLELDAAIEAARRLGMETVWLAGGLAPGVFDDLDNILSSSGSMTVGTSVLNIWTVDAPECVDRFNELDQRYPGRLFLGLGVSHAPAIAAAKLGTYAKPLATMRAYLDALDAHPQPIPGERLMLGGLGPRMIELSAERTRGSVPYLVSADHTRWSRSVLGDDAFLAPELTVALHHDRDAAMAAAREHLSTYLGFENYTNNFARFGFGPEHLADGGSDQLIEAVYAVGDEHAVARRIREHLNAGADHVALQIVPTPGYGISDALMALSGLF